MGRRYHECEQLRQIIPRYEEAVTATVRKCAERWDYTQQDMPATRDSEIPGSSGGGGGALDPEHEELVVVGGVRYGLRPDTNSIRALEKPYDS